MLLTEVCRTLGRNWAVEFGSSWKRSCHSVGKGAIPLVALPSNGLFLSANGTPLAVSQRVRSPSNVFSAAKAGSYRQFSSDSGGARVGMEDDDLHYPTGGQGLYRRVKGPGFPMMYIFTYDKPSWQPLWEDEHEVMPRDEFGVPASIPPEISTKIKHVYYVPPQFYPFLKKLGDDTPSLKPYMDKLINGKLTFDNYEEMFYKFVKPLKIYRKLIPMPYRTALEMSRSDEVAWESAWLSFRQRVSQDYFAHMQLREYISGIVFGAFAGWVWIDCHRQYRIDMKLFYLEAPEHKINWVKPRGDLV